MIRTVTLNPAVDVSLEVAELLPVHKNRATMATREAGGGGVNVARLLVRFGAEVEAVVAVGGATGAEIVGALADLDVPTIELPVSGSTRESVQIHDERNDVRYRITIDGPPLQSTVDELAALLSGGPASAVSVFSGSLPTGCDLSVYAELSRLHPSTFSIVDTSGGALRASVEGSIDLIKPSLRELEGLVGHAITNAAELRLSMDQLLHEHPSLGSILTSLGAAGAVLGRREVPPIRLSAPAVPVVSAVGAGDSVVAGVAWGVSRGEDLLTACRLGVAAGTATVGTPGTSLCSAMSAQALLDRVETTELRSDHAIR